MRTTKSNSDAHGTAPVTRGALRPVLNLLEEVSKECKTLLQEGENLFHRGIAILDDDNDKGGALMDQGKELYKKQAVLAAGLYERMKPMLEGLPVAQRTILDTELKNISGHAELMAKYPKLALWPAGTSHDKFNILEKLVHEVRKWDGPSLEKVDLPTRKKKKR
jgi:hypothetical protein